MTWSDGFIGEAGGGRKGRRGCKGGGGGWKAESFIITILKSIPKLQVKKYVIILFL